LQSEATFAKLKQKRMFCFSLFNLAGGELILILTVIFILLGVKRLPELVEGLGEGFREFIKATREVSDELGQAWSDENLPRKSGPPFLMVLTVLLGTVCLVLLAYEFSK
jgi:sec-independent protein translocase protein TatA